MIVKKDDIYLVLKWDDVNKYLNERQKEDLNNVCVAIKAGRAMDLKPVNEYWVCNKDEPYADKVITTILNGESDKAIGE